MTTSRRQPSSGCSRSPRRNTGSTPCCVGTLPRWPRRSATTLSVACVEGARQGYRTVRTELGEHIPPHAVDAVLNAYHTEGKRLVATARAIELEERALRGEIATRSF